MAALAYTLRGSRLFAVCLAGAVLGAVWVASALSQASPRMAFGYLTAFCFAVSTALGALLLLLLGYVIHATWMSTIRRLSEAVALALVPLAVLFVPIVWSARLLYVWTRPEALANSDTRRVVLHNAPYLNLASFALRAALYFAIWIVTLALLRRWSRARHTRGREQNAAEALAKERGLSSAMMLPVVLAITFCAFDWLMSLQPAWFSAAFGLYFLTGGVLSALALITLLAQLALRAGFLTDILTPHHFHALGRMLFAFTILWAYLAYFQLFLIVLTDKPREVSFYLAREAGGWLSLGRALALGHFAAPVLLLARRSWKFHGGFLASLSCWLLLMHYADLYYLVMPVLAPQSALPSFAEPFALLFVVCACMVFCLWQQAGRALVAEHDPLLSEGMRYRSEL